MCNMSLATASQCAYLCTLMNNLGVQNCDRLAGSTSNQPDLAIPHTHAMKLPVVPGSSLKFEFDCFCLTNVTNAIAKH